MSSDITMKLFNYVIRIEIVQYYYYYYYYYYYSIV
jgi:hypothetical protein